MMIGVHLRSSACPTQSRCRAQPSKAVQISGSRYIQLRLIGSMIMSAFTYLNNIIEHVEFSGIPKVSPRKGHELSLIDLVYCWLFKTVFSIVKIFKNVLIIKLRTFCLLVKEKSFTINLHYLKISYHIKPN